MAKGNGPERIPAKELREYLKLPIDQALSKPGDDEVRILPDGRVLRKLLATRIARVWPSREAYTEWWRGATAEVAKGPVDHTLTLLPPIDDFLRDVGAHAKSLGPRIKVASAALDGTVASLDAVDKALTRIPWAKRQVPDLVTPLVAYVGEVLRRASDGQWIKPPTTWKQQVPVYDPVEAAAYHAAWLERSSIANAAADNAATEARKRRASASDVAIAINQTRMAAFGDLEASMPKPIRFEEIELPIRGSVNEPVITAGNGRSFQPFNLVFVPMVEPSKRLPLRAAVETTLIVNGVRPPGENRQDAPKGK